MPPGEYFVPHLQLIQRVIKNTLIKTGYFRNEQTTELEQRVHEQLLLREQKILTSFRGEAKFSTFLAVIVTNICREIRKSEWRYRSRMFSLSFIPAFSELSGWFDKLQDNRIPVPDQMVIIETTRKLETIFKTYPTCRVKIEFCLKAVFRIPVRIEDLQGKQSEPDACEIIKKQINTLNIPGEKMTKTEIYKRLTVIFNLIEKQQNTDDAIRKWLDDRMNEIIRLLNGNPQVASFNRETLQYLCEYYYQQPEIFLQTCSKQSSN